MCEGHKHQRDRLSVSIDCNINNTDLNSSLGCGSDGCVEWTLTPVVLDVGIGSGVEQLLHKISAGTHGGQMERRPTKVVCGVEFNPSRAEEGLHGAVERGSGDGGAGGGGTAGVGAGDQLTVAQEDVLFGGGVS